MIVDIMLDFNMVLDYIILDMSNRVNSWYIPLWHI